MADDYYAILGLDKSASQGDIKKAYHKVAIKCHPDKQRNKSKAEQELAEEKFKLVSEAYEVLSDDSKRKVYDMHGKAGLDESGGASHGEFSHSNAHHIFNQFFGGRSMPGMGSMGSMGSMSSMGGMGGIPQNMKFSFGGFSNFDDASTFEPPAQYYVNSMGNTRSPPSARNVRPSRRTRNTQPSRPSKGPNSELNYEVSIKDYYLGVNKRLKIIYDIGNTQRTDLIDVDVKRGMREGVKFTYPGKSSCKQGEIPGDLILILKESSESMVKTGFYRRSALDLDGSHSDLIYIIDITLDEATKLGVHTTIKYLDGREIKVDQEPLNYSTDETLIKGMGMPIRKSGYVINYGDLYIRYKIRIKF